LKGKQIQTQDNLFEKQLEYFKTWVCAIDCTQMNMVQVPNNLIHVIIMAFNWIVNNNNSNNVVIEYGLNLMSLLIRNLIWILKGVWWYKH
jgi:hypothetical protein